MIIAFTIGTTLGIIIAWNRTGKLDTFLPPALAFLELSHTSGWQWFFFISLDFL